MKRRWSQITTLLLGMATLFSLRAQPSLPTDSSPSFIKTFPVTNALDTDGDGVISAEEIAAANTSLKQIDKNGDGKLRAEELLPRFSGRSSSKGQNSRGRRGSRGDRSGETPLERIPPEKLSFTDGVGQGWR